MKSAVNIVLIVFCAIWSLLCQVSESTGLDTRVFQQIRSSNAHNAKNPKVEVPQKFVDLLAGPDFNQDVTALEQEAVELNNRNEAALKVSNNFEAQLVLGLENLDYIQKFADTLFKKYFDDPRLSYRPEAFASRRPEAHSLQKQLEKIWNLLAKFENNVVKMRANTEKTLALIRQYPNSPRRQAWIMRWRGWLSIKNNINHAKYIIQGFVKVSQFSSNLEFDESFVELRKNTDALLKALNALGSNANTPAN